CSCVSASRRRARPSDAPGPPLLPPSPSRSFGGDTSLHYNRQISRRLHEEHTATLALWGRVEQMVVAGERDPALMRRARAALADELTRHFGFEESDLFPRLAAAGESDIATLL